MRRRLFNTTLTELKAISAEAHMGVIWNWIHGVRAPAASGIQITL